MRARLYYQQTPNERYDTEMNQVIEEILKTHSLTILGSSGGSGFGDADDMCAENDFDVEGRGRDIRRAVQVIIQTYERHVDLKRLSGLGGLLNRLKENIRIFVIVRQLRWQRRHEPATDPNDFGWLSEDEDYTGANGYDLTLTEEEQEQVFGGKVPPGVTIRRFTPDEVEALDKAPGVDPNAR
jgi:hypothetical protein